MSLLVHYPLTKGIEYKESLIDYSTWQIGTNGNQVGFEKNGEDNENTIVVDYNPWGKKDIVWASLENSTTSDADGGFNANYITIDKTKTYRLSVWIKRKDMGNGRTYFGLNGNGIAATGGTTHSSNPYFWNGLKDQFTEDEWVLFVGYVYPSGTTTSLYSTSGIYTKDGTKKKSVSSYNFIETSTTLRIRSYLYYSTKTDEKQFWYRPRIDLVDGTEPSLTQLLAGEENPDVYNIWEDISGNNNHLMTFNESDDIKPNIEGKIGGCAEKNKISNEYLRSQKKLKLDGDFTYACWCKATGRSNSSLTQGIFGNHRNTQNKNLTLQIHAITDTDYRLGCSAGNGITRIDDEHHGVLNIKDVWSHLCIRYDSTNKKISMLVDGIEEKNFLYSLVTLEEDYLYLFAWSADYLGPSDYRALCKLNDVRVYDEYLSDKEVYELSKAKILHLKFNDIKEPRKNLYKKTDWVGHGSNWELTEETLNGYEVYRNIVSNPGVGNNFGFNSQLRKYLIQDRKYFTFSFYIKLITDPGTMSGYSRIYYTDGSYEKKYWNYTPNVFNDFTTYQDRWILITETVQLNQTKIPDYIQYVYVYKHNAPQGEMLISQIQVEQLPEYKKYIGDSEIEGEVVDSSAFTNNALAGFKAFPTTSTDSNIGSNSSYFNLNNNMSISNLETSNELFNRKNSAFTYTCFLKINKLSSGNGGLLFGSAYYSGFGIGISGVIADGENFYALETYYRNNITQYSAKSSKTLEYGKFYFVSAILDMFDKKIKFYLNGDFISSRDITLSDFHPYESHFSPIKFNAKQPTGGSGPWITMSDGVISDLRIYATALSDKDIKNIYESRFNLDNKGNFTTYEIDGYTKANQMENGEYNLVSNGNMQLEDTYNFPSSSDITYQDTPEKGIVDSGSNSSRTLSELIEFDFKDTQKQIEATFDIKNISENGTTFSYYTGLACYDKNKNFISIAYITFYEDTRTTLSAPLNNGDTTVSLTSSANWRDGLISPFGYLAIFDNYDYPLWTYTRKVTQTSGLPIGNIITLRNTYTGPTIPTGTNVCQSRSGSTFTYLDNKSLIDGQSYSYKNIIMNDNIRYGTKYIKPILILNRGGGVEPKTLIKSITFIGKHGTFKKDKNVSFKSNGVYESNFDEIGTTEGLIGYWDHSLDDYSIQNNDLTNFGVIEKSDYMEFDGNSSGVIKNKDDFNVDYVTMISMVKTDGSNVGENIIMCKENSYEAQLRVATEGVTFESAIRGHWSWKVSSKKVNKNEWTFVASVWNGDSVIQYVNDTKQEFVVGESYKGPITHDAFGFGLGSRMVYGPGVNKGQSFFKGQIKNARVYNRILTHEEIMTLYKLFTSNTSSIQDGTLHIHNIKEV